MGLKAAGARNLVVGGTYRLHSGLICTFVMNLYCAKCWLLYLDAQYSYTTNGWMMNSTLAIALCCHCYEWTSCWQKEMYLTFVLGGIFSMFRSCWEERKKKALVRGEKRVIDKFSACESQTWAGFKYIMTCHSFQNGEGSLVTCSVFKAAHVTKEICIHIIKLQI